MYPVEIIEILDTSISRLLGPRNTSPFGLAFVSDRPTCSFMYIDYIVLQPAFCIKEFRISCSFRS